MARPRSSLKSKSKSAKPAPAKQARLARKPQTRVSKPSRRPVAKRSSGKLRSGSQRWVYAFGGGKAEGKAGMRNLLGGKGAGLAEMANLGLPKSVAFRSINYRGSLS